MIRRNTASQPIYLPQLRLTADGAAVTSSATIVVAKDGVEAASAGTLTHYAGGVWKYTPTQGETNCAIVGLILTATLADTVVLNLVTTAADTSVVAFGANTTAPDNASVTAIKAKTDNLPSDPADQSAVESAITAATSPLATAANLATVAGYLDTEIAAVLADTNEIQTDWADGGRLDSILDARASQTSVNTIDDLLDTEVAALTAAVAIISDGVGFLTSVAMGAISDAGTAGETYVITFGGSTYTVDYTGLDATGNRSATTRTKS